MFRVAFPETYHSQQLTLVYIYRNFSEILEHFGVSVDFITLRF